MEVVGVSLWPRFALCANHSQHRIGDLHADVGAAHGAAFVLVLLHWRSAIATENVASIEEPHETLVLWVGHRCFHCFATDRTLARAAELLCELLEFIQSFVERFGDLRKRVCRCGVQGIPDSLGIFAQFLGGSICSKKMNQACLLARLKALALARSFL